MCCPGLKEVAINNRDNNYLTSETANLTASYFEPLLGFSVLPRPTDDWLNFNLINRAGPDTWPISLVTFFYFRKDLTWLRNAGG